MSDTVNNSSVGGGNMKLLGVVTIILGVLAITSPLITGMSIALLVGLLVLIGGAFRMVWAFRADSLRKGLFVFAMGGLTLLCGLVLVTDPLFASGVLTVVLGVYFVIDGVVEVVVAFQVRPASGWSWLLFAGLFSFLLGVMIWRQFPLSGAWALGVLLGFKLLLVGMIMAGVGSITRLGE